MEENQINRRSFLKKSTVLAVAAANMSLLTGLVHADLGSGYLGYDHISCNSGSIEAKCKKIPEFDVGYGCIVNCPKSDGTLSVADPTWMYAWCAGEYAPGDGGWFRNIQCKAYDDTHP